MKTVAFTVAMVLFGSSHSVAEDAPTPQQTNSSSLKSGGAGFDASQVECRAISHDKKFVAVYYRRGFDEVIAVFEAESGTQICKMVGHGDEVVKLQFSKDGKTLAARVINRSRKGWAVWDASTGRLMFRLLDNGQVLESCLNASNTMNSQT